MNGIKIRRVLLAGAGSAVFAVIGCGFSLNITDGPDGGLGKNLVGGRVAESTLGRYSHPFRELAL